MNNRGSCRFSQSNVLVNFVETCVIFDKHTDSVKYSKLNQTNKFKSLKKRLILELSELS